MFEDYRSNFSSVFYPFVFFLRRYATLLVLTLLPDYTLTQILGQMIATGFVTFYIMAKRPFKEPSHNRMEAYNEATVLIAAYPLLIFTDWVSSEERKFDVGWFLVALICFNIFVNISALVITLVNIGKLKT